MTSCAHSCAVPRRAFLERSVAALLAVPLAVVAGGCASAMTRVVAPVNGTLRLALSQYPELTQPGGFLKVVPRGSSDPVFVFTSSGGFVPLSSECTHLGCTVEVQGARLVCPCHGSTYDRDGNVLQGPASAPLRRYRYEVTPDGILVINLS